MMTFILTYLLIGLTISLLTMILIGDEIGDTGEYYATAINTSLLWPILIVLLIIGPRSKEDEDE